MVGCLLIARIPDLFGRKWPLAITTAIQFPILLIIIFSKNLTLTTTLGFFLGILHVGIQNGAYINVCEYFHTKWKNKVCTVLLVCDMLTVIFSGFYFEFISNDIKWLLLFGAAMNGTSIIGLFLLPESPEYLYSFYRF